MPLNNRCVHILVCLFLLRRYIIRGLILWYRRFRVFACYFNPICLQDLQFNYHGTIGPRYIMFKIIAFFVITMLVRLCYLRIGILLACRKHVHDHIIALRNVPIKVVYQVCVPSHLCVSVIEFISFYDFDIWIWNCSNGVVFSPFILFAVIFSLSNIMYWYNYTCISCVGTCHERNMFSMCKMNLLVAPPPLPPFLRWSF